MLPSSPFLKKKFPRQDTGDFGDLLGELLQVVSICNNNWIDEHGTQIKHIHSIGIVGGGHHSITVKTENDNVYFKKSTH